MAERLKTKLVEDKKRVDIIVGPDAYRSLPELIDTLNVFLFGLLIIDIISRVELTTL